MSHEQYHVFGEDMSIRHLIREPGEVPSRFVGEASNCVGSSIVDIFFQASRFVGSALGMRSVAATSVLCHQFLSMAIALQLLEGCKVCSLQIWRALLPIRIRWMPIVVVALAHNPAICFPFVSLPNKNDPPLRGPKALFEVRARFQLAFYCYPFWWKTMFDVPFSSCRPFFGLEASFRRRFPCGIPVRSRARHQVRDPEAADQHGFMLEALALEAPAALQRELFQQEPWDILGLGIKMKPLGSLGVAGFVPYFTRSCFFGGKAINWLVVSRQAIT